jgi:hypothetical protein
MKESVLMLLFGGHALVVVTGLFLVFDHLAIQLVGQEVNGGIHVVAIGVGMDLRALGGNRAFGLVPVLLHLENDTGAGDVIEVALDPANLLIYVSAQGVGDFNVLTGNGNLHQITPE